MTDHRRIEDQAVRIAIEERVAELWRWRSWYRARAYTLTWPVRHDNAVELRSLVKLLRKARALSLPAVERADPMTVAKAWDSTLALGDHHVGIGQ